MMHKSYTFRVIFNVVADALLVGAFVWPMLFGGPGWALNAGLAFYWITMLAALMAAATMPGLAREGTVSRIPFADDPSWYTHFQFSLSLALAVGIGASGYIFLGILRFVVDTLFVGMMGVASDKRSESKDKEAA